MAVDVPRCNSCEAVMEAATLEMRDLARIKAATNFIADQVRRETVFALP